MEAVGWLILCINVCTPLHTALKGLFQIYSISKASNLYKKWRENWNSWVHNNEVFLKPVLDYNSGQFIL